MSSVKGAKHGFASMTWTICESCGRRFPVGKSSKRTKCKNSTTCRRRVLENRKRTSDANRFIYLYQDENSSPIKVISKKKVKEWLLVAFRPTSKQNSDLAIRTLRQKGYKKGSKPYPHVYARKGFHVSWYEPREKEGEEILC